MAYTTDSYPMEAADNGRPAIALKVTILAVAYFVTARLGLLLGTVDSVATPVWPPSGIALGALLLYGQRLWPGIACGALIANLDSGLPFPVALSISAGNTLAALCGFYLLRRAGVRAALDRLQDVAGLIVLGALLSPPVSATVGVTSAWLGGTVAAVDYGSAWSTWCLGDALGDLVVAPLVLTWAVAGNQPRRVWETVLTLVLNVAASLFVFGDAANQYPGAYLVFPFLIWSGLRLGQCRTAAATLITSVVAIWGTANGHGPFVGPSLHQSLFALQVFMGVVAVTTLVLAAAIAERGESEVALRDSERRYRSLVESSPDAILVHQSGRFVFANQAAAALLGAADPGALIGRPILDIVHPEYHAIVRERTAREHRGEEVPLLAQKFVRLDGGIIHVEVAGIPFTYRGVPAGQIVVRDVTERWQAEARTAALLDVAKTVSGTLELWEMLDRVHRRTVEVVPCDAVATFYWDFERDRFRMLAQHGLAGALLEGVRKFEFSPGMPFIDRLRTLRTVVINDVGEQEWVPPELLMGTGIAALTWTQLHVRGRALGVSIAFNTASGRRFDKSQVQLLQGIADQLAVAIEASELYEAQHREATVSSALARVGRELISSLDRPTLLDRLCQLTTEVLHCDASHTLLCEPDQDAYVAVSQHGYAAEEWEWLRLINAPRALLAPFLTDLDHDEVMQRPVPRTPNDSFSALAKQLGWSSVLCLALRRGGELIGIHVACYRRRRQRFAAQHEQIGRGIAQLASLALENSRLVDALTRANRLKSDFVATMSHELRTPLNAIIGYTELALEEAFGPLNSEQAEAAQRVSSSARQLLDLVGATLDLSRLESGRVSLDLQETSLDALMKEIEDETREACKKPHVSIVWPHEVALPPLYTDPLKLKLVLTNLVLNAVKFTDKGRVAVDVQPHRDGVTISVADTGIGIAPDAQAIIFEPFRQVDSSDTRRHGGVGLGLYIVRRLLDMLGGSVAVDSEVGRGTTFQVWVPLRVEPKVCGGATTI